MLGYCVSVREGWDRANDKDEHAPDFYHTIGGEPSVVTFFTFSEL